MFDKLLEWDRDFFLYLNGLGNESHDTFWSIITEFAFWAPLFLCIILLLFVTNTRAQAFRMLLTYMVMLTVLTAVIFITKDYVARLRPNNNEVMRLLMRVVRNSQDFSFFSGHAASSFNIITLTTLFLRKKVKWIAVLFLWPLLFSFSRIYLGVHYPLDIFVGALVGIFFAFAFYNLYQKLTVPYSL